jgi:hypothetical protein
MNETVQPNRIGKYFNTASIGDVSDVIVFDTELTYEQIRELYINDYSNGILELSTYNNIISYWSLNGDLLDGVGLNNLTAVAPIYTEGIQKAYLSESGNDSTAELNSEVLKYRTIDGALESLISAKARYNFTYLEDGSYNTPLEVNISIHNLNVIGATTPIVDSELLPTELINGTIIKGKLIQKNSIKLNIKNIGVDVGDKWCTDNVKPLGDDVLVIYTPSNNSTPISADHTITNVVCLAKSPSILFHTALFEYVYKMNVINLDTYYATHGIVFKASSIIGNNFKSYGNNSDGLIIKKDTVIDVKDINIDSFYYRNINSSNPNAAQIYITNDKAEFIDNITISNANLESEIDTDRLQIDGNVSNVVVTDINGNPIT